MKKITELKGKAHVFTLKDGNTLRIFARDTKEVAEENISNEMRIAENMGLIMIAPATKAVITKEVPKNTKKSGGNK